MKKLGKLVLQGVVKIPESEQRLICGGSGYLYIDGVNIGWCTDDANVTAIGPGFVTSTCDLIDMYDSLNGSANTAAYISIAAGIAGLFTNGFATLFVAGVSLGGAADALARDSAADDLGDAIINLQQLGYTSCDSNLRFYDNGSIIRVWNVETGEILYIKNH